MKSPSPIPASDYERLRRLWDASGLHIKPEGRDSQQAFEKQMLSDQQVVLGMESDSGELVGAVMTTHDGRKGWINRLAVHPDYRRSGIAKQLIKAAEEQLKMQGMTVIAALIEPDNYASLMLFISEGYTEWPGMHYVTKRQSSEA